MNPVITAVVTAACTALFTGGVTLFWKRIEKRFNNKDLNEENEKEVLKSIRDDIDLLKKADQVLLRERLWQHCKKHMEDHYCTQADKGRIRDMYEIYHSLGKNGIMDADVQRVYNLPSWEEEDEE